MSLSPAPGLTAVLSVPLPLLVSSNAAQNESGKQKGNRRLRKNGIQAGNKNRSQGASSVLVFDSIQRVELMVPTVTLEKSV